VEAAGGIVAAEVGAADAARAAGAVAIAVHVAAEEAAVVGIVATAKARYLNTRDAANAASLFYLLPKSANECHL
jgi:hypothetical protein